MPQRSNITVSVLCICTAFSASGDIHASSCATGLLRNHRLPGMVANSLCLRASSNAGRARYFFTTYNIALLIAVTIFALAIPTMFAVTISVTIIPIADYPIAILFVTMTPIAVFFVIMTPIAMIPIAVLQFTAQVAEVQVCCSCICLIGY